MYKEQLIALLEGLECQDIDKLLMRTPASFRMIGMEIAKYAKIGADLTNQCSRPDNICPNCGLVVQMNTVCSCGIQLSK